MTRNNKIKEQIQIDFVPKFWDIIVPNVAPSGKENVKIKKMKNFFMDSLLFSLKALYIKIPTFLKFPVQIVVLKPLPKKFLKRQSKNPMRKDTKLVTIKSETEVGTNPTIKRVMLSKTKANFLQSPWKLFLKNKLKKFAKKSTTNTSTNSNKKAKCSLEISNS